MPTITVAEVDYEYMTNPPHRNGTVNKSQWGISLNAEYHSFESAIEKEWRENSWAWGFYEVGGQKLQLGVDRDHATPTYIARFEAKNDPEVWHGYPVGRQDPPSRSMLKKWLDEGVLPSAKIAKISGRRRCAL